jgi:hypothetical protein
MVSVELACGLGKQVSATVHGPTVGAMGGDQLVDLGLGLGDSFSRDDETSGG